MRGFLLSAVVAAMLLGASRAALADNAVVVGVDKYEKMPDASLAGCANDARQMAKMLESKGFKVTLLLDGKASRTAIFDALRQAQSTNKANERFVFYFAGRGAGPKPTTILTASSVPDSIDGDIQAADFMTELRAIPASGRTVILDAGFGPPATPQPLTNRYFARTAVHETRATPETLVLARGIKRRALPVPNAAIPPCAVVATLPHGPAFEKDQEGKVRGVFTTALLQGVQGAKTWGEAVKKTQEQMMAQVSDAQHPTVTTEYVDVALFDGGAAPLPSPSPTADEVGYSKMNPDANKVALLMEPAESVVQVGTQVAFTLKVGAPGYLVLLERGTSGRENRLFPDSGKVDDAKVSLGQTLSMPSDPSMKYAPDTAGKERLVGILFESRDDANALLEVLKSGSSTPQAIEAVMQQLQTKKAHFYTSRVKFEVK